MMTSATPAMTILSKGVGGVIAASRHYAQRAMSSRGFSNASISDRGSFESKYARDVADGSDATTKFQTAWRGCRCFF
jgi:hypothetical protein